MDGCTVSIDFLFLVHTDLAGAHVDEKEEATAEFDENC